MSISYNVYVGPYIDIETSTLQRKVDKCATHQRPEAAKFCPECGLSKAKRYDIQQINLCESFLEDFYVAEYLPTAYFNPDDGVKMHMNEVLDLDYSHSAALAAFKEKYEVQLDEINKLGINYSIEFGVIAYTC